MFLQSSIKTNFSRYIVVSPVLPNEHLLLLVYDSVQSETVEEGKNIITQQQQQQQQHSTISLFVQF